MIRGMLFQSARQVRRAAARAAQKQRAKTSTGRPGETRRSVCDLACEESVITKGQKNAFGRPRYSETLPRVLAVGGAGVLNLGAIDALNIMLQDLAEDDDDGR